MINIQGICYDAKSSFQRGPAKAPLQIREALRDGSMNMFAENLISIDDLSIADHGDFGIEDYHEIENITANNFSTGEKLLTLGGDHSITYPIIKAIKRHNASIDILQIDAHSDLYDEFEGDKFSHACPFARIMEDGLVNRLVQVGIRTMNPHQKEQAEKYGVEIHYMKDLNLSNIQNFENPLYISLDLDGIDPAFAPGVSHHEPGGLSPRQVLDLIQNLRTEVIGADIVEYSPFRDTNKQTAYLAAKLMKEILVKMT